MNLKSIKTVAIASAIATALSLSAAIPASAVAINGSNFKCDASTDGRSFDDLRGDGSIVRYTCTSYLVRANPYKSPAKYVTIYQFAPKSIKTASVKKP